MAPVDFGLHSDDYARHRPGFPASFYDRLQAIQPLAGIEALDLGCGPGIVTLELARRGARTIGRDISAQQVEAAKRVARDAGLASQCDFGVAPAEDTGLPDGSVDLVTAGQCWVWFDEPRALTEIERVLRPGGHLVVAHYYYLPTNRLARLSEDLVLELNPQWKMAGWNGLYTSQVDSLQTDRLRLVEQFCYDHQEPFSHEGWRGRMRTCNGVGSGGMTEDVVQRYDDRLAELLKREFSEEPVMVAHRVWAVVCRRV